ncbi:MAG TPA: hypothetical protein VGS78_06260 [Candidatus Sulfotelmatobacter sp.]|nr:hypothetical protein [Candidatus Sulfotelmatobacter sp.]
MKTLLAGGILLAVLSAAGQDVPKIFVSSTSTGNTWAAFRDQSQEVAKDFEKDCPQIQVTGDRQSSDYFMALAHIEIGLFNRMNQIKIEDMLGNVLVAKDVGSIRSGVKQACAFILADWKDQPVIRTRLMNYISSSFQKEGVLGYVEVIGNDLIVRSERASAMRFRMIVANSKSVSYLRRAGIVAYVYTNDGDKKFVYDVNSGQISSAPESPVAPQ